MKKLETICVHPVTEKKINGAVTSPVFLSAAYQYLGTEERQYPGFYSTYNQRKLGEIIARLEQGEWGMVFSSGMAAISTAILSFAQHGDHVVFSRDLYGGTWKLSEEELPRRGIGFSYAGNSAESFESAIRPNTKVIYIETPSNPLLKVAPLQAIADIAKSKGIVTIVDNTFSSPVNQMPILHGIDISVHSGTKYLGGHNDLPYGALVSAHEAHRPMIFSTAKMYGGSLSPYECYLAERSIKTLALRIRQQNENAMRIAEFLAGHPLVANVYYPGLPMHPDHRVAASQMKGFGGMLSFELDANAKQLVNFQQALMLIAPALSLGGVESLICSPAETSHRNLTPAQRAGLGISDTLLRLSVGIEDADDLIGDLEQAISKSR